MASPSRSVALKECVELELTSSSPHLAINSGTPKDRYWFGYVFRGGPTTQSDYVRVEGVQDSVAYTIVPEKKSN